MSEKSEQRDKDRNQSEWENPRNWSGGAFGIYKSEKDTRVWVPKRNPKMGWTFNFAKPTAYVWLALLILVPLTIALAVIFLAKATGNQGH